MKDLRHIIRKSNQMWLKWTSVVRDASGVLHLKGAEFYGPVLLDCDPMEPKGHIILDLTLHYIIIIPKPYLVKVSWDSVIYQSRDLIKFKELLVEDNEIGHLNRLSDRDQILLNCTSHTTESEARGIRKMAFQAMVYNELLSPYDFSK